MFFQVEIAKSMKTPIRVTLIVAMIYFGYRLLMGAVIVGGFFYMVSKSIDDRMRILTHNKLSFESFYINPFEGTLVVDNLHYNSLGKDSLSAHDEGQDVFIRELVVQQVGWRKAILTGNWHIANVVINGIRNEVYIHMKDDELSRAESPIKATLYNREKRHRQFVHLLTSLDIDQIVVTNGSSLIRSSDSLFASSHDSLTLRLNKVHYVPHKKTVSYNDASYRIAARNLKTTTPDGLYDFRIDRMMTADAGAIYVDGFSVRCTAEKQALVDLIGKQPSTWVDIRSVDMHSSPVNVLRCLMDKRFYVDTVYADAEELNIFRDERYPASKPYPMPQTVLSKLNLNTYVGVLIADIGRLNVELATTNVNKGELNIWAIHGKAYMEQIHKTESMVLEAAALLPGKGRASMYMRFNIDAEETYSGSLQVKDFDASRMDQFLRPLVGVTVRCQIPQMDLDFQGDRKTADGDFCLQYKGLGITAYKNESPYQIVNENATAINIFANIMLPHSNPTGRYSKLRSYKVHAERNPMEQFPYVFARLIGEGAKSTLLPGLNVSERIKMPAELKEDGKVMKRHVDNMIERFAPKEKK